MPIMSKPSGAPRTALTFITIGVLLTIPSLVWYIMMLDPENRGQKFFCVSLILLGIAFLIIGFSVGYISRAARHAELPPQEVTGAVARSDQMAARPAVAPQAPNPPVIQTPPNVVQAGPSGGNP